MVLTEQLIKRRQCSLAGQLKAYSHDIYTLGEEWLIREDRLRMMLDKLRLHRDIIYLVNEEW